MAFALAVAAAAGARAARAQVVLDGSLGGPAGARVGPDYLIPQSVGRLSGPNLFHSFSQFNVNRGESATFTAPGGSGVRHVIARVTGGGASNIDGLLRSAIPDADLVLVNPAGVAFGPGARLDVQGAFVATTADYVALADGTRFAARPDGAGTPPVLSTAPPRAFGFLGNSPASITYTGDPTNPAGLSVPAGRTLALAGGDVRIVGGRLQAVGGRAAAAAITSGELALDPADAAGAVTVAPGATLGAVELTGGASLEGRAGGRVVVRGGDLTLDGSSLVADTDAQPGGGIDVDLSGALDLRGGAITSQTNGPAPGGPIRLRAGQAVRLSGLSPDGGPPVSASTTASGAAGGVTIDTGSLRIDHEAAVASLVGAPDATTAVSGAGGAIDVTAATEVVIDGTGSNVLTGLASQTFGFSTGPGGPITVRTPRLVLTGAAEINATTRAAGRAGDVSILAGPAGEVLIDAGGAAFGGVQARVGNGPDDRGAAGRGGTVTVEAGNLRLVNGGVITASTFGTGDGGDIRATLAGELEIRGAAGAPFTGLFARTVRESGGGRGGEVVVRAGRVRLADGGQISSTSTGTGRAGGVSVTATRSIALETGAVITAAATRPPGAPDTIVADAGRIELDGGRRVTLAGGSSLAASATRDGGNVVVRARDAVLVRDSQITGRADRDGGQILIDPTAVVLSRSVINGLANGRDVRVEIAADALLTSDSQILTDTAVLPPDVDVAAGLVRLPGGLASAAARLQEVCGMRFRDEAISTFFAPGRGGTPPEPAGWQAGATVWGGR